MHSYNFHVQYAIVINYTDATYIYIFCLGTKSVRQTIILNNARMHVEER